MDTVQIVFKAMTAAGLEAEVCTNNEHSVSLRGRQGDVVVVFRYDLCQEESSIVFKKNKRVLMIFPYIELDEITDILETILFHIERVA